MTKSELIMAMPIIREALAMSTGGDITGDKNTVTLTIFVDAESLFAKIDLERIKVSDIVEGDINVARL